MNGVSIVPGQYSHVLPVGRGFRCKSIMVRPSISRGRGYAVVVKKDENEDITIRPALRTTKLARIGRLNSFPKAATISDLPDFVMQKIFSYTTEAKAIMQFGTVSKHWRRIINTTYVKKPTVNDRPVRILRNPKVQALETAKLKIFRVPASTANCIETTSQRKEDVSFRDVTIRVAMDSSDDGNRLLLNYLGRLAMYLLPTKECLLADFELTDALLSFLFTVWQPKLTELRLFRCSFEKISQTSLEILTKSKRLKHLYIDDCPIVSTCPLADQASLAQLFQTVSRVELCFCPNESFSPPIDNQFLELLIAGWKTRADIRWLKLRAPMITTDGIENLILKYFKLRGGFRNHEENDKKVYAKIPKLLLWLCETSFDVDDFLSRRYGKRYFREVKLPTSRRRQIQDSYSEGGDLTIWIENKDSK